MAQPIVELVREAMARHGYWAVGLTLLLENAGLPLPGETVLLLASFLAYSRHELQLPWIIVVAICAAALGDNLGFFIGDRGGRLFLRRYQRVLRIPQHTFDKGERIFAQYGAATIFFARFIFGLRVIAGPLAGVLRMPWKKFAIFNVLGATLWVFVISAIGYKFGKHWDQLIEFVRRMNIIAAFTALIVLLAIWYWRRTRPKPS
jgi:membrane protein DedA with SNARE-associated domain